MTRMPSCIKPSPTNKVTDATVFRCLADWERKVPTPEGCGLSRWARLARMLRCPYMHPARGFPPGSCPSVSRGLYGVPHGKSERPFTVAPGGVPTADGPILPGTARYARVVYLFQHSGARLLPPLKGVGFRREEISEGTIHARHDSRQAVLNLTLAFTDSRDYVSKTPHSCSFEVTSGTTGAWTCVDQSSGLA
jgi:hypothetical protein